MCHKREQTWRQFTYHKEHLSLVFVGEQEEAQHSGVWDLVVKSLTMQMQEGGVDTNVISARRKKTTDI